MYKDKIKSLCKEKGITIHRLETECEIGHDTIRKWDEHEPNITTLRKIAKYFNISICELLEIENE